MLSRGANLAGKIQRLIFELEKALAGVGTRLQADELERVGVSIYEAMGAPMRQFHTLDHVFSFPMDNPVRALAAIFHDIVYLSVDKSWPAPWNDILTSIAGDGKPGNKIRRSEKIPYFDEIVRIFGVDDDLVVPKSGLNELFSAMAFSSTLGKHVSRETVIETAACIEATIPFRGTGPGETLYVRLMSLGHSKKEAALAVRRALRMAADDLVDFRNPNPSVFLSGTWKLLPELNPELRLSEQFNIGTYRKALQGMESFFEFLEPDKLFDTWCAEPKPARLKLWLENAGNNLRIAREYLKAKLLAAAILEGFALATGTDVPLPLFMGSASFSEGGGDRLENHLPVLPEPGMGVRMETVFQMLETGRQTESSFDLKNSPLAAFVYRHLSADDFDRIHRSSRDFFSGKLSPEGFLNLWPSEIRAGLAGSLADFVPTRKEKLAKWTSA